MIKETVNEILEWAKGFAMERAQFHQDCLDRLPKPKSDRDERAMQRTKEAALMIYRAEMTELAKIVNERIQEEAMLLTEVTSDDFADSLIKLPFA